MNFKDRAKGFADAYARGFKARPDIGVAGLGMAAGGYAPYIGAAMGFANPEQKKFDSSKYTEEEARQGELLVAGMRGHGPYKGQSQESLQRQLDNDPYTQEALKAADVNLGDRIKGAAKGFVDQVPTALAIAGAGIAAGAGLNLAAKYAKRNPDAVRKAGEAVGSAYRGAKDTVARGVENIKDIRRPAAEKTVDVASQAVSQANAALPVGKRGGELARRSGNAGIQMADLSGADIQQGRYTNPKTGEMAPNVQEFNAVNLAGGYGESLVDRTTRERLAEVDLPPKDYQSRERKVDPGVQAYVEQKRTLANPDALESQLSQSAATERVLGDLAPRGVQSPKTAASSFAQGYVQDKGYVDSKPEVLGAKKGEIMGVFREDPSGGFSDIMQGANAADADSYQANRQEMRELRRNEDVDLTAVDARTNPDFGAATPEMSDTAVEGVQAKIQQPGESAFETEAQLRDDVEVLSSKLAETTKELMSRARGRVEAQGYKPGTQRFEKEVMGYVEDRDRPTTLSTGAEVKLPSNERIAIGRAVDEVTAKGNPPGSMVSQKDLTPDQIDPRAEGFNPMSGRASFESKMNTRAAVPGGYKAAGIDADTDLLELTGEGGRIKTPGGAGRVQDFGEGPDVPDYGGMGIYGRSGGRDRGLDVAAGAVQGPFGENPGDYTTQATRVPSLERQKAVPGTEKMTYPVMQEGGYRKEIGIPDAQKRSEALEKAQISMSRNPPGSTRFERAQETVTDITETMPQRKERQQQFDNIMRGVRDRERKEGFVKGAKAAKDFLDSFTNQ